MHVDSTSPSPPRPPGRSDAAQGGPRPADAGRGAPPRDVYEGPGAPLSERASPSAGPDRVDLSSAGRHLGQDLLPGPRGLETPEARAARVESLARDLAQGRLFTPDRLQQAASRLLSPQGRES